MSLDTTVYGVANYHEVLTNCDDSHFYGRDIRSTLMLQLCS